MKLSGKKLQINIDMNFIIYISFMVTFLALNGDTTIEITPTLIFGILTFCKVSVSKHKKKHSLYLFINISRISKGIYIYIGL